jgi:hypothetical protein
VTTDAGVLQEASQRCARAISSLWSDGSDFSRLFGAVRAAGEPEAIVLFGGAVRDAIHAVVHREAVEHRDMDIVLRDEPPGTPARTRFGGYRLMLPSGRKVDYWGLRSTYAFTAGLLAPSFSNLLRSTVFTLNACMFDLNTSTITENGALDAIRSRAIRFNCRGYLTLYPEFQSYRALDYADRLSYELDGEVRTFVAETIASVSLDDYGAKVRVHRPTVSPERLEYLAQPYHTSRRRSG